MSIVLLLLAWPTPDELKALPDVAAAQVRSADTPTHRVIHVLDWHYVPEKRFRIDTPDADYDAFLDDVEALQAQRRTLIKAIGVKAVFLEGLTSESTSHYQMRVAPAPGGCVAARRARRDADCRGAGRRAAGRRCRITPPIRRKPADWNSTKWQTREDGIAKALLAQEESVIILGGEHDLSDNMPANVEYVRVTLKAYKLAAERE